MSEEGNKALYRRLFEEAINQGRLETVDELVAPNYVNYNFPAPMPGAAGFAEGDTVIGRGRSWAAIRGPFRAYPRLGRR